MKQCNECGSTYSDRIDFCFHDGSELVAAAPSSTAASLDAALDLPTLDAPLPATPVAEGRRSDLTPLPLGRMQIPEELLQEDGQAAQATTAESPPEEPAAVVSPLAAPPPPATQPSTEPTAAMGPPADAEPASQARAGTPPTPLDPATATPPPSPAPSPAPSPVDSDEPDGGVPLWVWGAAGAGVVILVGAATLFALGGLSVFGAAVTTKVARSDGTGSPVAAATRSPDDADVRFPEGDDERFPEPPLEVGVVAVDSDVPPDTDSMVDTGLGAAGAQDTDPAAPVSGTAEAQAGAEPTPTAASSTPTEDPSTPADAPSTPTAAPEAEPEPAASPPSPSPGAPDSEAAGTASDDTPWGAIDEPSTPPPADQTIQVTVSMDGDSRGLWLYVDGQLVVGSFPYTLDLAPGMHRFRVEDTQSGKSYDIGKPIRAGETGKMTLELFPP